MTRRTTWPAGVISATAPAPAARHPDLSVALSRLDLAGLRKAAESEQLVAETVQRDDAVRGGVGDPDDS